MNDVTIRELTPAELPEIAAVHLQSFPESAASRLGYEAVRRYYSWQFQAPHKAYFLGAWVEGQLAGFCLCGVFRGAFSGFVKRNRRFLAAQLVSRPWLCRHAEVRAALSNALRAFAKRATLIAEPNSGSENIDNQRFGILAIATAPEWRRFGLGKRLMTEAESIAKQNGFLSMGLTVHPTNESAVHFYEKLGWERISSNDVWLGAMVKHIQ